LGAQGDALLLRSGSFEQHDDPSVDQRGHPDGLPAPLTFVVESVDCGRGARGVGWGLKAGKSHDQVLPDSHGPILAGTLAGTRSDVTSVQLAAPCCERRTPHRLLGSASQGRPMLQPMPMPSPMVVGLKHDSGVCGRRPKPGVGRSPEHHIARREGEPDRPDRRRGPDGQAEPAPSSLRPDSRRTLAASYSRREDHRSSGGMETILAYAPKPRPAGSHATSRAGVSPGSVTRFRRRSTGRNFEIDRGVSPRPGRAATRALLSTRLPGRNRATEPHH
jgi:hypothetical protein